MPPQGRKRNSVSSKGSRRNGACGPPAAPSEAGEKVKAGDREWNFHQLHGLLSERSSKIFFF